MIQLQLTKRKKLRIEDGIYLVFCVRNEFHRIEYFLDYYRRLGVAGFLAIDNDSSDGTCEYLLDQADCSVWHTKASYKNSNFGMEWCNYLITKYLSDRWVVCCDPDEFIVYPSCEDRNLVELTTHMDRLGQQSLFCMMVDTYGRHGIEQTELKPGQNPFEVAAYFDDLVPSQRLNGGDDGIWIQGGVRMRAGFRNNPQCAPAINKVPLIKWRRGYRYLSSMHHTNSPEINFNLNENPDFISGCIMHFKYVSSLTQKAKEEIDRKQHYGDSIEYKKYLDQCDTGNFDECISRRYTCSTDLEHIGFMQRGIWY